MVNLSLFSVVWVIFWIVNLYLILNNCNQGKSILDFGIGLNL